jgi:hypothetical protein
MEEYLLKITSSLILRCKFFQIAYSIIVENEPSKILLFKNRLPFSADGRIAGAEVWCRWLKFIILYYLVENHQADLGGQSCPVFRQ